MKTIIITGASGGIGSEIAKKFNKKDVNLVLIFNKNKLNMTKLKKELKNCNLQIFQCDLTSVVAIQNLVQQIITNFNKIDYLINCAGVSHFQLIQDTTEDDFNFLINNNLKSTYMLTSAVCKYMITEKYGKIVNISSIWGVVGSSYESLYALTKGAINNLTLSLAKELGPSNITVNSVCPGLIDTNMNKNLTNETINSIIENTPLNRIGTPKDVANLVEFLVSEKASFITGQTITIDGGFTL